MKKMMLAVLISVAAFAARADVITNTVVIVSNFYSQAFIETVVTQKVKSSHTDYFFTNHEYTVTHDTLLVSQTNLSVNVDVGRDFVIAASNQANRAASAVGDSRSYADASARSSTAAASSASSAASSASSAAATRSAAASECASALATINARINWFDQHSGQTITQNNYHWTTNLYFAEDSVARSMAAEAATTATNNASAISSLEGRVGNNIETLQGQLATANGRIDSNASAISSLEGRVGNNISTLQGQLADLGDDVSDMGERIGSVESAINPGEMSYSTQVVYRCDGVSDWSFKFDSLVYTMSGPRKIFAPLEETKPSSVGQDRIIDMQWNPVGYNYGVQIDYYVGGSSGYITISQFFVFPDSFSVGRYTFRKHSERFVPMGDSTNVLVRAVPLFGESYNPKKTEGQMLADVIDRQTANLSGRVEALESNHTDLPESIGMYTRHRPSVTYSYYYTYGGSKLLYRVKVYSDNATVVESSGSSTTYGYDFEILYKDSSIVTIGLDVDYVRKIIYQNDPASNEIVTRLYRNGYSMYKLRGFSDDLHDLKGGASVGDRLTCYSNSAGYFVMQLDAVDNDQSKELQYRVGADFNVYDAGGSKIGRVMRDTDWSALSNWVERVFQKK